jgi:hypothetical protein
MRQRVRARDLRCVHSSRTAFPRYDQALLEGLESAFNTAGENATASSSFEVARQMLRSGEYAGRIAPTLFNA